MRSDVQLIRVKGVALRLGVHRSTIWRWTKQGLLPKPIPIGPNSRAWLVSDINAFVESRAQGGRA
jgi:prophage regulatory protein